MGKRSILVQEFSHLSHEETSGLFSRALFLWLGSLLAVGSRGAIKLRDLFSIHRRLDSDLVFARLQQSIHGSEYLDYVQRSGQEPKTVPLDNQSRKYSLVIATLKAWPWETVKIIFPRLAAVACNLLQPFLVQAVVDNVLAPNSESVRNDGYGLIGAVAITYCAATVM